MCCDWLMLFAGWGPILRAWIKNIRGMLWFSTLAFHRPRVDIRKRVSPSCDVEGHDNGITKDRRWPTLNEKSLPHHPGGSCLNSLINKSIIAVRATGRVQVWVKDVGFVVLETSRNSVLKRGREAGFINLGCSILTPLSCPHVVYNTLGKIILLYHSNNINVVLFNRILTRIVFL